MNKINRLMSLMAAVYLCIYGCSDNSSHVSPDNGSNEPVASCSDGIKNGDETDADCGGSCSKCADNLLCNNNSDCVNHHCEHGTCKPLRNL